MKNRKKYTEIHLLMFFSFLKKTQMIHHLICFFILIYLFACSSDSKNIQPYKIPFRKIVDKTDLAFNGVQYLCIDSMSKQRVIRAGFNYLNNTFCNNISFDLGLANISMYYATGEEKYIRLAKETASLLDSLLPENGLIPEYSLEKKINPNSTTYTGTWGQANTLSFVCALSEVDSTYKSLTKKLADGLLNYSINPKNNLVFFQLNSLNGKPYCSSETGYESQLGSSACTVAQSLLLAYKVLPEEKKYLTASLKILKSIWELRSSKTNLIPECYDVLNNKNAENLYPENKFRYDDMGGAYIRALTLAFQVTQDIEIQKILNKYTFALLKYCWDKEIGGGGFRYLSDLDGNGSAEVETMYGLFIATLIEASQYVDTDIKETIILKCKEHADNIYLTDFGVKNYMIPHDLSKDGKYMNKKNDSQLAYAVIQFPLGMTLLTNATNDYNYLYRTNCIIDTLLERHKTGDNIKTPLGYVSAVETQPPFKFEMDYYSPSWCYQFLYLPSYMLFSGILPNKNVRINWFYDNSPCVVGLVAGMPLWDLKKVNFKIVEKKLTLNDVTSNTGGEINFAPLGFEKIIKVFCDNVTNLSFKENLLFTEKGLHKYTIFFK